MKGSSASVLLFEISANIFRKSCFQNVEKCRGFYHSIKTRCCLCDLQVSLKHLFMLLCIFVKRCLLKFGKSHNKDDTFRSKLFCVPFIHCSAQVWIVTVSSSWCLDALKEKKKCLRLQLASNIQDAFFALFI